MLVAKATVSGDVFHAKQDVIAHCKAGPFFNVWWKWGSNLYVHIPAFINRIFCLWRVGHRWFLFVDYVSTLLRNQEYKSENGWVKVSSQFYFFVLPPVFLPPSHFIACLLLTRVLIWQ